MLFNTTDMTFLWLKTYTYIYVYNIHITYTVIVSQLIAGNL